MIYGTKLVYKYREKVPKTNELGETLTDSNGDFITEEIEKKLDLTFSAITFIIYKNYTGREFMQDFISAATSTDKQYTKSKTAIDKLNQIKNDIDIELTEEDIKSLASMNYNDLIEFYIGATAAMKATTEYPVKRDFAEIINELPLWLFTDKKFINELTQLISFNVKKNKQLV